MACIGRLRGPWYSLALGEVLAILRLFLLVIEGACVQLQFHTAVVVVLAKLFDEVLFNQWQEASAPPRTAPPPAYIEPAVQLTNEAYHE